MDNLDDSSLVAAVKRLTIMISDKDAILLIFSMINAVNKFAHNSKPAESNREDNKSVEKALMKNVFNATKIQKINLSFFDETCLMKLMQAGIFPSTFLQLINGSKNLILN